MRAVREVMRMYREGGLPVRETGLYNEPPEWLRHAHDRLDAAVAEAYGFNGELEETAILEMLLDLNLARAG